MEPTIERWMLYLRKECQAGPWPWTGKRWDELKADDVSDLPHAVADFARYSPSDGSIDMGHVPADMPREVPRCVTQFAACHDERHVYAFIRAVRPPVPITELADLENEDFGLVVQLNGVERGLYFGLNEKGEAIGCVQTWDEDLQPQAEDDDPFDSIKTQPGVGPALSPAGILSEGYATRIIPDPDALTACFRIEKTLLLSGMPAGVLQMTAGRRCYRTAEMVSWGSSITWRPRTDRMAQLRLVDRVRAPHLPVLRRVDLVYDPSTESGELTAHWDGPVSEAELTQLARGGYANYMDKTTLALNGIEQAVPIRRESSASFAVPNGWNRLEVLTAVGPPTAVTFQKLSGNRLCPPTPPVGATAPARPTQDEVRAVFRVWHDQHEEQYIAPGTWGTPGRKDYCLCHCGVFNALPYALAYEWLEAAPVYRERVIETCERALAAQDAEGWYPCDCGPRDGTAPARGDGGAFTNGSVGETMLMAARLFDRPGYTDSARRAADYGWYRWEDNQNYAGFALWHLAALFETDGNPAAIDKAVYYARHFVSRDIGLSGAQDGHNYYTGYGNITLKGLACLLRVLPAEHEFHATLRDHVIRFANQTLSRQQPSGLFAGRNRKYIGFHHVVPGLFAAARAVPETAAAMEPALLAMYRAVASGDEPYPSAARSADAGEAIACMGRYLTETAL